MNVSREAVMSALFTLLSGATFAALSGGDTEFATKGRRVKLWSDVPAQPAIYVCEHNEDVGYQSENLPSKSTMRAEVFVYVKTGDAGVTLGSDLNNILDGIDAALKPSVLTGTQTLGGLVSHCRVDGTILKDPGDLDGQGLAIIPIKILVP